MKNTKTKILMFLLLVIIFVVTSHTAGEQTHSTAQEDENINIEAEVTPIPMVEYIPLGVPNINSSFKTWMSYKAVTDRMSSQYRYINTYGWSDEQGFMRSNRDEFAGIEDDYYLIALGSYYGTQIGTKYRITLDTGKVFYGVLADCKDNKHTNITNQYVPHNKNIIEFIVNTSKLNKDVKVMGNANYYEPLNGHVIKIERMDFINQ